MKIKSKKQLTPKEKRERRTDIFAELAAFMFFAMTTFGAAYFAIMIILTLIACFG